MAMANCVVVDGVLDSRVHIASLAAVLTYNKRTQKCRQTLRCVQNWHGKLGGIRRSVMGHVAWQPLLTWWRHQMETFSALLAICAGNSPVPGEFPAQRPVTRCFDVFLDLRLNKRLSKQWWGWWFETLSCPLWRHRNGGHCPVMQSSLYNSIWDRAPADEIYGRWNARVPNLQVSCSDLKIGHQGSSPSNDHQGDTP